MKDKDYAIYDKNIVSQNMSDTCTDYMKLYGANDNIMRHLSSLYDGLQLCERRVLYTMYEMGLKPSGNFKKVSTIVGQVMNYHPHGDTTKTIVKLAQPWNNIQCTIDGQGNFASEYDREFGAPRYIEAKLSKYAYKCFFEEFSPNIVDMRLNYLEDRYEPEYLPARYPNMLINNIFGIGYGISTGVCTFNLKEVIELTRKLMEDPEYSKVILYPDSPTGSHIVDQGQFKEICKTGKGKFMSRGVIEIDETNNILIIKNTPFQRYWDTVQREILALFGDNGKMGNKLSKINYVSTKAGGEIHLYLKKEANPYEIRDIIYAKTNMQVPTNIRFNLVDVYEIRKFNLKSLLLEWIDFRRETKRRLFQNQISTKFERIHILEVILMLLSKDNAEKFINIMRNSDNRRHIIDRLVKQFGISELQAKEVSGLKGYQYAKDAHNGYIEEYEKLGKETKILEEVITHPFMVDKYIDEELKEGIDLFGENRRSKIITVDNKLSAPLTKHVVIFSKHGYVKKLPNKIESIGDLDDKDYPTHAIKCTSKDILLLFDNNGNVCKLAVENIPSSILSDIGTKLNTICGIQGELVSLKMIEKNIKDNDFILVCTQQGMVKKSLQANYFTIKQTALSIVLNENDIVAGTLFIKGDTDILLYTNKGNGLRFNTGDIRQTARVTKGLKSIDMEPDEYIIGICEISKDDQYILLITNNGKVKKCKLDYLKTEVRNSKPLKLINLTGTDRLKFVHGAKDTEEYVAYMVGKTYPIRVMDVSELPRMSSGVKMIPVPRGEVIIDVQKVEA